MTWWLAIIMLALSFGATEGLFTTTAENSVLRLNYYGVQIRAKYISIGATKQELSHDGIWTD